MENWSGWKSMRHSSSNVTGGHQASSSFCFYSALAAMHQTAGHRRLPCGKQEAPQPHFLSGLRLPSVSPLPSPSPADPAPDPAGPCAVTPAGCQPPPPCCTLPPCLPAFSASPLPGFTMGQSMILQAGKETANGSLPGEDAHAISYSYNQAAVLSLQML